MLMVLFKCDIVDDSIAKINAALKLFLFRTKSVVSFFYIYILTSQMK